MPETSFDDLLNGSEQSAFKLELRDAYMTTDPAYLAWQAGRPLAEIAERYAEWTDLARKTTARGVRMRRVRVVTTPVSDYIRYEHAVTEAVNLAAGEDIRWLPRGGADLDRSQLTLPSEDFWVIDGSTVMWLHFSDDHELTGSAITQAPEVTAACQQLFLSAWDAAIPHRDFGI